jgi:hypothetical protein
MHTNVGGGDKLVGEGSGSLLGAQRRTDENTGIRRQAPGQEVSHVFGLPPAFIRQRTQAVVGAFRSLGMPPKYQFHLSPPFITLQFAEYTVYTVFAILTKETDMTKTTAPRKPAAKKTAPARKTAPVKAAAKPEKKHKKEKKAESKVKVVRDSFTMPQADYDLIAELKQKALKSGLHVKKSELLRASLQSLSKLTAAQLKRAIDGLEKIKTGRPKKN